MTQDERWLTKYNELKAFIETNHRNPSRYRIEEYDMLNRCKANRKRMNAGALEGQRLKMVNEHLALGEKYKRVNQWK